MSPTHILVVEDSATQAEQFRLILAAAGFDVQVAADGGGALQLLADVPFQLVVSDILMPGISGYDLCRRIKATPALAAIPVILLTSLTDPIDVVHALECGADSFLSKPCEPDHLVARVNSLLASRQLRAASRGPDVEVIFQNERFSVAASREQVIDLLLSAFEDMARKQEELVAARDALAEKHQELLRIEHQKEELSALVVHDLRSPAAGIMMAAQSQLRRTALSESDRKLWSLVFTSTQVINRMVLNLLDISSSSDGGFAARPALVDIPALLTSVHQLMMPLAESMAQDIEIQAPDTLPQFRADPELLRRILQNLIDNALRHGGPKSRVVLNVEVGNGAVTFRVCDTGPGVPPAMRERIFDKYTRIPRQPGETGSFGKGLGLAFCRIAAEAHGGRIWVEDNVPKGSVFVVQLPLDRPDQATFRPERSAGSASS